MVTLSDNIMSIYSMGREKESGSPSYLAVGAGALVRVVRHTGNLADTEVLLV
jgi:hypothetical protein